MRELRTSGSVGDRFRELACRPDLLGNSPLLADFCLSSWAEIDPKQPLGEIVHAS